jgi:ribosomal protein S18 acetylase RimI-like enzyme
MSEQPLETAAGAIIVRSARLEEIGAALAILEEACRWLAAKGIDQWPTDIEHPNRPFSPSFLADKAERGELYLASRGEQPVGTLRLQWSDPFFWGERPADAGYVHGLAISRAVGGQGVGLELLRWAERTAASAGRRYLRLDCMAENPALRAYYERAGYTCRGEFSGQGWKAALYEKAL